MRIYKIKVWINHHWEDLCDNEWFSIETCLVEAQTFAEMSGQYVRVVYFDRSDDVSCVHTPTEEVLAHFSPVHKPFMLIVRLPLTSGDRVHCWGTYSGVSTALSALRKTIYKQAYIYDIDNKTILSYAFINGRYKRVETHYLGGF